MVGPVERRLIVGLGNPGPAYRGHRHNIGFRVVEALAAKRGLVWRNEAEPYLLAGKPESGTTLLKPMTYMNLSGEAIRAWAAANWQPIEIPSETGELPIAQPAFAPGMPPPLVICDDLALPLGALRLRARGGSGGQNGLASILEVWGSENVPRLRLGVAPTDDGVPPETWSDYVLSDFEPSEQSDVAEIIALACEAVDCWLETDVATAASRHNRRPPPPTI